MKNSIKNILQPAPGIPVIFLLVATAACNAPAHKQRDNTAMEAINQKAIGAMLDSFNVAAANADFDRYFSFFADSATFIGTDATERWNKQQFMTWAKPHFDNKHTWDFKVLERHIYPDKMLNIAWFDELLNTRMKICRGSGVVTKEGSRWKLQQYVLSMTIPNAQADTVISIKTREEEPIINKLLQQ